MSNQLKWNMINATHRRIRKQVLVSPEAEEDIRKLKAKWHLSWAYSLLGFKKNGDGASLVAQWLRICLPMQGTRVRALVWEDPTCRGATRSVSHNYWACASGACAPQQERPRQWEARAPRWRVVPHLPQLEKALAQKRRPNTAKNK